MPRTARWNGGMLPSFCYRAPWVQGQNCGLRLLPATSGPVDKPQMIHNVGEVFVRRSYFQHGIMAEEGAVVVDAGANIGLFSLQCLREANGVQVYAFEPIPAIYSVLVHNLHNSSSDSVKAGTCPKPIALRVGLGAEQAEEVFYFFRDKPGESTRHREERSKQQEALAADADAACWRKVLDKREHPGGEGVAAAEGGARGKGQKEERGESFLCSIVPLSLALRQLGVSALDLLKVDVEGDELAVLRGIGDDDWPKIRQIVLEVHDVDGRLAATIDLLASEPAAFDEICWEPQLTSEVGGYVMVVPKALQMFLVFAKRRPMKTSSIDEGSATEPVAIAEGGNSAVLRHGQEAKIGHSPRVVGEKEIKGVLSTETIPMRACCCSSAGSSSVPR